MGWGGGRHVFRTAVVTQCPSRNLAAACRVFHDGQAWRRSSTSWSFKNFAKTWFTLASKTAYDDFFLLFFFVSGKSRVSLSVLQNAVCVCVCVCVCVVPVWWLRLRVGSSHGIAIGWDLRSSF